MDPGTDSGSGPIHHGGGRPRVVVGVDGSPGSRAALVHAFTAAAQRGAELDVVSSYHVTLVWTGGSPLEVPGTEAIGVDTESRAGALVDDVRRDLSTIGSPGVDAVDVRLVVSQGHAVAELLKRSEHADLLVVGSRGRGAMRSALLGSVALHCATHAPCPVVVVHPMSSVAPSARVVVGVDGSAGSRAALVAALQEAGRTGAEVEVVATYFPTDSWTDATLVLVQSVEAIRADLQRRTEELVGTCCASRWAPAGHRGSGPGYTKVRWRRCCCSGPGARNCSSSAAAGGKRFVLCCSARLPSTAPCTPP
jgi:nucleotide-binding universal stress UspA family protein